MERVASWWDGFELWLAGLSFVPQAALVLIVMVPLCGVVAWLLDRVVATGFAAVGRGEPEPSPAGGEPAPSAPNMEDC
ncbi:hypothetical protein EV641_10257 [Rhodococcus sp. SMB37]|uniref:hypothetical protein n=1 Tax=Rhodococcus sp. SMB37 TaxID=2512213 RepID=UPI00104F88BE|nr:hypothetical protein [Rhodococcus sp. SMB37]TCN56919.1 hypothetical protein EV641_10257 [Rhodococcus sp. SMB37]